VQVVPQRADVVDADHLPERLEDVEVGMRPSFDASHVTEEGGSEGQRCGSLPDAGRAVQEIGVRGLFRQRRGEQSFGLELLRY
jgi:hypothetical protein